MKDKKKIIVIGGGAGGAGAAAKCRRLDEFAEIVVYERSGYASYSNCGLPYYFSKKIPRFESLILNTVESLKGNYNLEIKVRHEVIDLDVKAKKVVVKNWDDQTTFEDWYDELIIAAGAPAMTLKVPGIEKAKNVFSLKTPDDVQAIENYLLTNGEPNDLVIVGGGFIGTEIAENFKVRGVKNITIVDAANKLFAGTDRDIAAWGHKILIENGIDLQLAKTLKEIKNEGKIVVLNDDTELNADLIFMTIGIKPELTIYEKNGIKVGKTGGIITNKFQQTNIKHVYAVGDLAETFDLFGEPNRSTLAAPASRQAVVAANTIYGVTDEYKGSYGSRAISLFGWTIASIGKTEAQLKVAKLKYQKVIAAKQNFLGLLGGTFVWLKVIFDEQGTILGAQAVGPKSSEKRISYIAILMSAKKTIYDMVDFQIAYNPVVDNSFDAVNIAGRIARLVLQKNHQVAYVEDVKKMQNEGWEVIDVRNVWEIERFGKIPNSISIPWDELRERIRELDQEKKYIVYCRIGMRSYNATLILQANGFKNVRNLSGSYDFWEVYTKYRFGKPQKLMIQK